MEVAISAVNEAVVGKAVGTEEGTAVEVSLRAKVEPATEALELASKLKESTATTSLGLRLFFDLFGSILMQLFL